MMNKVELLSPAGNFEKLRAAILYGADAVYLAGKRFGMRAAADNFTDEELYGIIRSNPNVKRCVVELIEQANRRGGTDNISAIIFEA